MRKGMKRKIKEIEDEDDDDEDGKQMDNASMHACCICKKCVVCCIVQIFTIPFCIRYFSPLCNLIMIIVVVFHFVQKQLRERHAKKKLI